MSRRPAREQMRAASTKGDLETIARTAHRLRGTVVYLGAAAALADAEELELASMACQPEAVPALLERLEQQLDLLREALQPHRTPPQPA